MSQTTITQGQSLVDVALQEFGSVEALFDLADAAGLAITDVLAPGLVLAVPRSSNGRPDIAALFAARTYRVNTGNEAVPPLPEPAQRYFSSLFFNPDTFA